MAFGFTFNSFCNNNADDMVDAVTFAPFAPRSSWAVCKNMQRVNQPSLMSQRTRTPNSFTQHYTLVCSYLLILLLLGLLKQKTVTGALQLYQTTSLLAAEREKRRGWPCQPDERDMPRLVPAQHEHQFYRKSLVFLFACAAHACLKKKSLGRWPSADFPAGCDITPSGPA